MISYLDALVDLDAGHDAELLDEVDEGLARVRLLEERLVEQDHAGDALQLCLLGGSFTYDVR